MHQAYRYIIFPFLFAIKSLQITAQGSETFSNIPAAESNYATRTWKGDNASLTWSASDARTDQVMNRKAIVSSLFITDFAGRTISIQNINTTENNVPVNVRQLPLGRYFVTIKNKDEFINQSFVIIR
ncbi:MAG: hypothetical protein ABI760_16135 [Ferruginibacter sp.]